MSHVLVVYASKHGSTAEIATAIAKTLDDCGMKTTCAQASEVHTLDPYDGVVLGSAVYARRWRREARRFLRDFAAELAQRPFWVFSSGPVGAPGDDNPDWSEPVHTIARAIHLGVRDHVVFGGAVPADPQGMMMRSMTKNTPEEFRDRRDWDAIRAWAEGIADTLRVKA